MHPFDTQSRRSAQFFSMDDEEFARQLREGGWGQGAIEQELKNLHEYKKRFRLEPMPELDLEEAAKSNEFMAAVLRKRRRKTENGD